MKSEIHYLNTDLDLVAKHNLAPLAAVLQAQGIPPLHMTPGEEGNWHATFEVAAEHHAPEEALSIMLDAAESLSDEARMLWSGCAVREFNIGYVCGDQPWAFSYGLSNRLLVRMSAAGASLRITLYPPEPGDRA